MNIIMLEATEEFSNRTRKMLMPNFERTPVYDYCAEWKSCLLNQIRYNTLSVYNSITNGTTVVVENILANIHPKLLPEEVKIVFYRNNHGSFSLHNKNISILVVPDSCIDNSHSFKRNIFHEMLHGVLRRSQSWPAWKQRLVNIGYVLPPRKEYDKSQIGEEYLVQAMAGWEFGDIPEKISAIKFVSSQIDECVINQALCKFEEVLCHQK